MIETPEQMRHFAYGAFPFLGSSEWCLIVDVWARQCSAPRHQIARTIERWPRALWAVA